MATERSSDKVRVVVRVRPMSEKEIHANYLNVIEVNEMNCCLTIKNPAGQEEEPPKMFTFDSVFGPDSTQLDVYNLAARAIIENVLEGYNGTIFAYGQTGTGKTFTMEGVRSVPELKGVIPNSFAHIFGHIAKAEDDKKFLVRVSYLEIYNEEVRDLLRQNQNERLEVKERPDVGVYVKDLITHVVHNADEMDKIMTLGNKNRATGSTNMNTHSSRSHAIFTITIECAEKGSDRKQHWRVGKLHLVDLAGSERQSKTGATGIRLKEASKINLSLSTLGNVISALVDGKSTHIPYRNSKLTRLLQDSLGGNSKTLMCANVGPAAYNYDESISTLRYASRAKNICNKARINEDPKDALLRKLQEEIRALKGQLEQGEVEDEESSGEEESPTTEEKERTKKRKHKEEELEEIRKKIEEEKRLLSERKDMEEEERNKVQHDLDQHEKELKRAQKEQEVLKQRLLGLERKILVGGENLLEKAEEQERLLEESASELEERKRKQEELREAIHQKEAERIDMEERYSSLQDEAAGKSRKMKKVWSMLLAAKSELSDIQAEHQREMEALLESVRLLSREHKLNQLIIDSYVPLEYQEMIERYVHWNEDIGEWQLKCVAYTGNNMRKQMDGPEARVEHEDRGECELWNVYHVYSQHHVKPKAKAAKPKPKKSAIPRPKHVLSSKSFHTP